MKLWLISQDYNTDWDTYDSAVVAAETEEDAVRVQVGSGLEWAAPEHVTAIYLGEAREGHPPGMILGSFNAG